MPDGAAKPPDPEPVPTGKGGTGPEGSCLTTLMGEAAARAERPARRMVVAYMLLWAGV